MSRLQPEWAELASNYGHNFPSSNNRVLHMVMLYVMGWVKQLQRLYQIPNADTDQPITSWDAA